MVQGSAWLEFSILVSATDVYMYMNWASSVGSIDALWTKFDVCWHSMTWTVEVVGESLNCYLCLLSQSSSGETQQVLCACLLFWYRWRWGLDHRPSKFKLHGKVFIFAMIFFVAADSFVCWCSSLWNSYDIETFPVSQISWRWHIFQLDGTLNTNNPLIHGS